MKRDHALDQHTKEDASKLSIGIVVSKYYSEINNRMLDGAIAVLREWGVPEANIHTVPVSGSFEIPYGCLYLLTTKKPDAIITLGCIVKGETDHDKHIANAVIHTLMRLTVKYGIPISLGIMTVNTLEQAEARSTGENNKGAEAAVAALEMALLR